MLSSIFAARAYSAITLQPHQAHAVDYLVKNPKQKGILLYHSLGSGKTYLSLAYTEKNPDKKVIVLAPRFLKSNWLIQMESFGVKDPKRYELISYEEIDKFDKLDISKMIVIIDEVHKLVAMVHHRNPTVAKNFSDLYFKLRKADKIIALSGTPIFSDASDIAFIGNLITGKDNFPYDRNRFRVEYQKVKPVTSLFRGYMTESKLMGSVVPFVITMLGVVTVAMSTPVALPLVAIAGSVAIPYMNEQFPAGQTAFREFDPSKMKDFTTKYISFYNIEMESDPNYPRKNMHAERVHLSDPQTHFFLDLCDEDLNKEELRMILAEDNKTINDEYINFHSMDIQRQFLMDPTVGREIGNFSLVGSDGERIEAPKFERIFKHIQKNEGSTAVYSNYYVNGILKFAEFLDRKGMKDSYIILEPELSIEEQMKRIDQYNKGKKRILLIHPEITEGVSLLATEQLHVLEPIPNKALLDQVIGRAVRYRSHIDLPKKRQRVDVYVWESFVNYSNYFPTSAGAIRRMHWQKRYSEINPSMWTKGILEIDRNYFRKEATADTRILGSQDTLGKDMENFKDLLKDHSIESLSL